LALPHIYEVKEKMRSAHVTVFLMALLFTAAGAAQSDAGLTKRGIVLRKHASNVTYDVVLLRGTERATAPVNYRFQSGDRFALRVRVAVDSYVYVLNRTFVGSPDELKTSRQVRLVPNGPEAGGSAGEQEQAAKGKPVYALLYPRTGSRMLKAGVRTTLPGSTMALEMDKHPGVEHLILIVSPTPLRIRSLFDSTTGELRVANAIREDSAIDVAAKLDAQLAAMANNVEAEESATPARSIVFMPVQDGEVKPSPAPPLLKPPDTTSVAAPKRPGQPFLVDVILAHYPR
jgi:hypothetical protein